MLPLEAPLLAILVFSDLDECESGDAVCSGSCVNVPGGYYCSSVDGYGRVPGDPVDKRKTH